MLLAVLGMAKKIIVMKKAVGIIIIVRIVINKVIGDVYGIIKMIIVMKKVAGNTQLRQNVLQMMVVGVIGMTKKIIVMKKVAGAKIQKLLVMPRLTVNGKMKDGVLI